MTGIASTTANLALWRLQWETLFSLPHLLDETEMEDDEGCRLSEIENFGENPGNLRMFQYVPADLGPHAPLVVVLHGCTQTAAGYDRSSGWSWLAEKHGFAVLFAQQRGENNPRRCFNWFRPHDIVRESGEAGSIRHMVDHLVVQHDLDRQRIFITGLSAGGAMTNVMLASYPEVFAAGAVIAGLPYRSAKTVHDALQVMREGVIRAPDAWGDEVRGASPAGELADGRIALPWPRVAVWQGLADDVVNPSNAVEIVKQWANVHGVDEQAKEEEDVGGTKRMRWRNAAGEVVIEAIAIEHLGHAVPINAASMDLHEQPGPHFADIGLSSTVEIARFFGILPEETGSHDENEHDPKADIPTAGSEASLEQAAGPSAVATALAVLPPPPRGRRSRSRGREAQINRQRPNTLGVSPPVDQEGTPPVLPVEQRGGEGLLLDEGANTVAQASLEKRIHTDLNAEAPPPFPPTAVGDGIEAQSDRPLISQSHSDRQGILSRIANLIGLSKKN